MKEVKTELEEWAQSNEYNDQLLRGKRKCRCIKGNLQKREYRNCKDYGELQNKEKEIEIDNY